LAAIYIIAGPNGAGKSTNSKALLANEEIIVFDYDLELHNTWSMFSYDPAVEDGVRNSVSEKFLSLKKEAIVNKTNFAFETNYHHVSLVDVIEKFRESGHEINLDFIALADVELAIERVKDRVSKGGHSVNEKTIRERFELGLALLDNTFQRFDVVRVYESKDNKNSAIYTLHPSLKQIERHGILKRELQQRLPKLESFISSIERDHGVSL
jgi:predicted ABC-type ATPase